MTADKTLPPSEKSSAEWNFVDELEDDQESSNHVKIQIVDSLLETLTNEP